MYRKDFGTGYTRPDGRPATKPVGKLREENDWVVFCEALGSGKTRQVIRWLRSEMKKARANGERMCFIYAVHRRLLGQDLQRRFQRVDAKVLKARAQADRCWDGKSWPILYKTEAEFMADKELVAMPLLNFRYDLEREFDDKVSAL